MKFILAWVMTVTTSVAFSCDVCNLFSNVFPNENYSKVGLVYRSRLMYGTMGQLNQGFQLKHSSSTEVNNYRDKTVKDIFNVLEVRAHFTFKERWRVSAFLPMVNNYRSIEGYTLFDIYNIGDPLVMGEYMFWGSLNGDRKFVHRMSGGLGIKMPVGKRGVLYDGRLVDDDLQPGTGSWDVLAMLNYRCKIKSFGVQLNQSYRVNTYGFKDFKYGNSYNANSSFFYIFNVGKKWKLMPQTGLYFEQANKDRDQYGKFENSGGHSLYHNAGLTVQWDQLQLACQYQYRFYHQLNGIQIPTKNRFIVSVYYQFNLKKN